MKVIEIDMIVPVFYVDWSFFSSNVKSWIKEIPLKTLYLGCNNPNDEDREVIEEFVSQYEQIEFVDLSECKTLGKSIAELMKLTTTEWLVYCHGDVNLFEHSFSVMEKYMAEDVGIIESDRIQYDYAGKFNYPTIYPHNAYRERSFSGYQLIQKRAIESILDVIEDDYIYRNEDIIFQNVCTSNGFKYLKPKMPLHVHTTSKVNHKWTPRGESGDEARAITFDMQIKGIVKYCTPDDITKKAWRDSFGQAFRTNETDLFEFIEDFVREKYPQWVKAIQETIMEVIRGVYT